jgi:hypothetical protein
LPDILKICWSGRLHKWMYMNIYIYIYIYAYLIMLVHVMLSSSFFFVICCSYLTQCYRAKVGFCGVVVYQSKKASPRRNKSHLCLKDPSLNFKIKIQGPKLTWFLL